MVDFAHIIPVCPRQQAAAALTKKVKACMVWPQVPPGVTHSITRVAVRVMHTHHSASRVCRRLARHTKGVCTPMRYSHSTSVLHHWFTCRLACRSAVVRALWLYSNILDIFRHWPFQSNRQQTLHQSRRARVSLKNDSASRGHYAADQTHPRNTGSAHSAVLLNHTRPV